MPDSTSNSSTPTRLFPVDLPEVGSSSLGPWSGRAICAGEDPALFFPDHGDPGTRARQVCANCPVRIECTAYAIAADESGIWGGLDREQRRELSHAANEQRTLLARSPLGGENRERA